MAAEVTYAIKGDKANFIILTAVGESKIAFVPYGQTDGQVHTTIKLVSHAHSSILSLTVAGIVNGFTLNMVLDV